MISLNIYTTQVIRVTDYKWFPTGSQAGRAPVAKSSGDKMGENKERAPRVQKSKVDPRGASVSSDDASEESVDVGESVLIDRYSSVMMCINDLTSFLLDC